MNLMILLDPRAAVIVLGGTLLGTWLRAGNRDMQITMRKLCRLLGRQRFDGQAVRAELALQVQEIRQDGLLRAQPRRLGDSELDDATDAMIGRRSVAALIEAHEAQKARRVALGERAMRTLAQGAELAPVFGLAGTLISLSQLPADGLARGAFMSAISMAVVTTLYGLLVANLLLAPLARMVERASHAEEAERQDVIDWRARQVTAACPAPRAAAAEAAAHPAAAYDVESAA